MNETDMILPKLNPIEAFPVEHEGQELICLRDPYNISDKILYVSSETLFILGMFDGKHSVSDIREEILGKFGQHVDTEDIERLIDQMDEALFLDSEKFGYFKTNLESSFNDSPLRAANHAGLSYPEDPSELRGWIARFLNSAEESKPYEPTQGKVKGIISPHINFTRGGKSYALAYRELVQDSSADTYIIFGTSHYAEVDNPFILTRKNFDTPLGRAQTDTGIVDRLKDSCPWDLFHGEISHRTEHSIEFQLTFLQYLLNGKREFKIVPILCNSFFKLVEQGKSPAEDERIELFLSCVRDIVTGLGDRAFIIAGADMAHVGPKFGDSEEVNDSTLSLIKERDLLSLEYCEKLDAEGFYRSVEKEKDWRKICGLSPIYSLLSTACVSRGKILDYDQAIEPDTGSVVSFASAAFYS
jgi:MEMO1 family protein